MPCGFGADACAGWLKRYFVDLRVITCIMCLWLAVVLFVMVEIGIFANGDFVAFGPGPNLTFFHAAVDTYYKYNLLVVMIFMHTFITDVIADSLVPHVLNVVQDPKTRFMPHRYYTYIFVTTVWALYCAITQLFGIFLAFAQIDLLAVRFLGDVVANFTTMSMYMHGKSCNPDMYCAMAAEATADLAPDAARSASSELDAADDGGKEMRQLLEPCAVTPPRP